MTNLEENEENSILLPFQTIIYHRKFEKQIKYKRQRSHFWPYDKNCPITLLNEM